MQREKENLLEVEAKGAKPGLGAVKPPPTKAPGPFDDAGARFKSLSTRERN